MLALLLAASVAAAPAPSYLTLSDGDVVWRGTRAADRLVARYDAPLFVVSGSTRPAPHPPCTATGSVGSCLEESAKSRLRIDAGRGDDRVTVRSPSRDRVDCGPGDDVARVGSEDRVIDCETVHRLRSA